MTRLDEIRARLDAWDAAERADRCGCGYDSESDCAGHAGVPRHAPDDLRLLLAVAEAAAECGTSDCHSPSCQRPSCLAARRLTAALAALGGPAS